MRMSIPFRYHLLAYRKEQLWLPAALWALFVLLAFLFRQDSKGPEMGVAFLGFIMPLIGGVLAASIIVDDPALELQLAAPKRAWQILVERLTLMFVIMLVIAVTYQAALIALGVDMSHLGDAAHRQLAWMAPTVSAMALASLAALLFVQGTFGAMLIGGIWIIELLMRGWFPTHSVAKYFFWFMGANNPGHPDLPLNQASLLVTAVAFIALASLLLENEERYI